VDYLTIFQIAIGTCQVAATVLVAAVLYRQAQNLKRVEVQSQAIQAYNILNSVAVSSVENLVALDSLGRTDIEESEASRRRRWCAFIWLEALQETFAGLKSGIIEKEYAEQALRQQLDVILKDDLVFWLVAHRGFDPDFVEYCTRIREQLAPHKPLEYSEADAIQGLKDGGEEAKPAGGDGPYSPAAHPQGP